VGSTARPATEFLPLPPTGRRFTAERAVRLGDVDPAGHLRLDAIARYLQDVATDDAIDARLPNALGWVVRRTMIRVGAPAVFGERVALTTFCTGSGRSWAERRTTLTGSRNALVDAVSLWVQVSVATGRPARLEDSFFEIYGPSASGRVISSKFSLPDLDHDDDDGQPWRFRRADFDQFGHVNNASHWAVTEELLQHRGQPRLGEFELEYVAPVGPNDDVTLSSTADSFWLVGPGGTHLRGRWAVS
jgi:acyl-ACP thioesterase